MNKTYRGHGLALLLGFIAVPPLGATPLSLAGLGTNAPSGTVGQYLVTPVPVDGRAEGTQVTSVGTGGGAIAFDNSVTHLTVGSQWATWSNGYTGSVYSFDQVLSGDTLTLTLPANTLAFQFYIEPDFFGSQSIGIAASNGGASQNLGTFSVAGAGGAMGFGIYSPDFGPALTTVSIAGLTTFPGFAIGEFALGNTGAAPSVPDSGTTAALLAFALLGFLAATRRRLQ